MALPGSSGAAIGNNPIAFAIPLADRPALVFDMANSRVARNKVRETLRNKTMLPEGWAIGTDGRQTTDPAAALAGALLPLGDHKGIGLAMLVHALAGSLQGEVFSSGPDTDPGTAFLMVINPDHFVARTTFDAHVNHWLTHYLTATGAGARYPGQRAAAIERDRLATGVPLRASLVRSLRAIGDRLGQPFAPAEMAP
jgi:LDH2 family malate/lactate/ureidoglycolate dehydrogenase